MIALDTNVLVRLLVNDDALQTRKAVALFERIDAAADTAYVSDVAVCELVWVLQACYGFDRKQISATLKQVLAARQLTFDATENLLRALAAFERGRGDFADYLIREHAKAAECVAIATFDKSLLKDELFYAPDAVPT